MTLQIDDEVKQLARDGRKAQAIKLLRERTGMDLPHARAAVEPLMLSPRPATAFGVATRVIAGLLLAVGVIIAVVVMGVRTAESFLKYVVVPLIPSDLLPVIPWRFVPVILPVVAALLLVFGLPRARRFRRPERFRGGIIATAVGLVCFALLPSWYAFMMMRYQLPQELELPLIYRRRDHSAFRVWVRNLRHRPGEQHA